jgi:hypothetical protein
MKKLSLLTTIAVLLLTINAAQAQREIIINEVREYMSQGDQTGFEIAILDADPRDVENTWMRIMKKQKAKITNSKKSVEIFADNANIPRVSQQPIDIYAIASKVSYGTRLTVFVDLGASFISSIEHPEAYSAMESFLKDVGHQEAVRVVEEELKAQEAVLKELNKELNSFIRLKDGYTKDIEKAQALIHQREMDIENNIKSQETKRAQITIQEEIIETVRQKRTELDKR